MKSLNLILFIDDSEDDNEYHQIMIGRAKINAHVKSITDSRKALEYFKNSFSAESSSEFSVPDLVFIDINMPAINGFELLDQVKLIPDPYNRRQNLKVFMLTGSLNPDDRKLAAEKYSDLIAGFLIKPLSTAAFSDIAQKHFAEVPSKDIL